MALSFAAALYIRNKIDFKLPIEALNKHYAEKNLSITVPSFTYRQE